MPDRRLAEWLALLEARHPSEIDLGLDRVATVWSALCESRQRRQNPIQLPTVITVAGTNGKGSTIASMQAIMLHHGFRVGATTSPHFIHYNERISIQGKPVSDQPIVSAFEEIEAARGSISLTYFEFGTLAALLVFADAELDVVLLEVGLGGRLDAMNIIDADVAVVTSIALDHQAWLGETRELIAAEKLAIARPHRPLIIGEEDSPAGFSQMIADTAAKPLVSGRDFSVELHGDSFDTRVQTAAGKSLLIPNITAQGLLPINKTLAIQAILSAGFELDGQKVVSALNGVTLAGRQQQLEFKGVRVILDVAHNPAAAAALAGNLPSKSGHFIAVASVLSDKDWPGIVAPLAALVDHWQIAEISGTDRATGGQTLLEVLYNAGLSGSLNSSIEDAFLNAHSQATGEDRIIVFGSFFCVAAVLELIDREQPE